MRKMRTLQEGLKKAETDYLIWISSTFSILSHLLWYSITFKHWHIILWKREHIQNAILKCRWWHCGIFFTSSCIRYASHNKCIKRDGMMVNSNSHSTISTPHPFQPKLPF